MVYKTELRCRLSMEGIFFFTFTYNLAQVPKLNTKSGEGHVLPSHLIPGY